ncbi:hypothetical protein BDW60DRAFT_169417 [Aspergillus nidulans var. acristatus]
MPVDSCQRSALILESTFSLYTILVPCRLLRTSCLSIPWLVTGIVGCALSVSMPPCTYALLLETIPAMVLYDLCTCTCYLGKDASDLCEL